MSAGASPASDGSLTWAVAEPEPMLALAAAWRGTACSGCGQRPADLAPHEAVAVARTIQRRCAALLEHLEDSLRHCAESGSWSAMALAERVATVLATVNGTLRNLFGEDSPEPGSMGIAGQAPSRARRTPTAGIAALDEIVRRLVATIEGATAEDWDKDRPDGRATANEVAWRALHDAIHHVEDVELVLDGRLTGL